MLCAVDQCRDYSFWSENAWYKKHSFSNKVSAIVFAFHTKEMQNEILYPALALLCFWAGATQIN